jgi:hypothetical protein
MTLTENFKASINFPTKATLDNCVKISEEFAIGFAEYLLIIYNEDIIYDAYSKEELLEIYKKENGL